MATLKELSMTRESKTPPNSGPEPTSIEPRNDRHVPGTGKLLRRAEAAKLLGVSKSTLRRMEGEVLTPVVGPKNVRLFHEEEIRSVVVTRRAAFTAQCGNGEAAAAAFTAFDQNVHPVDVVKQLELDPDLVESLHARWARMRAMLVLSSEARSTIQRILIGWESGEIRTADDLCTFLRKWVADESIRTCWECKRDAACFCRTCAKNWGLRAAQTEIGEQQARRL
jgi:predicted site-specific integrase-resolvase